MLAGWLAIGYRLSAIGFGIHCHLRRQAGWSGYV